MNIGYIFSRGFHKIFKLNMIRNSVLDKKAKLCFDVQIVDSSVGRYSYIGEHSCVLCTDIGAFCSIADNCVIGGPSHAIGFVSTSPVFVRGKNIFSTNLAEKDYSEYVRTIIENDVWIGSGCLIKAGVHIQTGAVIGMGAVLTHDVGPYEIWAGNPARLIRKRFPDDICSRLVESEWWNLKDETLEKLGSYVDSPERFCEEVERQNG